MPGIVVVYVLKELPSCHWKFVKLLAAVIIKESKSQSVVSAPNEINGGVCKVMLIESPDMQPFESIVLTQYRPVAGAKIWLVVAKLLHEYEENPDPTALINVGLD